MKFLTSLPGRSFDRTGVECATYSTGSCQWQACPVKPFFPV